MSENEKNHNKSELEKKLEIEHESTVPDSKLIEQASEIPASPQEYLDAELSTQESGVTSLETVLTELEEKQKELDELKDRWLRVCAEFDNYRKRTTREIKEIREFAAESLIKDLLPVLDNFERALQHASDPEDAFVAGIRMVFNQLKDILSSRGLIPMETVGQAFNPNFHEALAQIESTQPEGTVVQEFERGYFLGNRVLRPAKVIVSKGTLNSDDNTNIENCVNNVNKNSDLNNEKSSS